MFRLHGPNKGFFDKAWRLQKNADGSVDIYLVPLRPVRIRTE
jgi:hypothetical protein